jgi:hypothetical protein
MRRGNKGALALFFVLALVLLGVAGCGEDLSKEADEGVPIKLGDLEFNVQETRFLNPDQPDDQEYLAGQQVPLPPAKAYLGVFLTIHNDAGDPVKLPSYGEISVVDTTGTAYQAIPSSTPFAAPLGADLEAGGDVPASDTAAASGPVQGGLVLFLVDQGVTENRPLKLEIDYEGETGEITLDI